MLTQQRHALFPVGLVADFQVAHAVGIAVVGDHRGNRGRTGPWRLRSAPRRCPAPPAKACRIDVAQCPEGIHDAPTPSRTAPRKGSPSRWLRARKACFQAFEFVSSAPGASPGGRLQPGAPGRTCRARPGDGTRAFRPRIPRPFRWSCGSCCATARRTGLQAVALLERLLEIAQSRSALPRITRRCRMMTQDSMDAARSRAMISCTSSVAWLIRSQKPMFTLTSPTFTPRLLHQLFLKCPILPAADYRRVFLAC